MGSYLEQVEHLQFLNQFWLSAFFLIPMVLVARAMVAGTRYSPILIIVVFGLGMGLVLAQTGVTEAGLPAFPLLGILSRTTIIALAVTFFVGGQEMRRIFSKEEVPPDQSVVYCMEEAVFGTCRTYFVFIIRAFVLLLGLEGLTKLLLGITPTDAIGRYYPLFTYFGLAVSFILIDNRAEIRNKQRYLRQGLFEIMGIAVVLVAAHHISEWIRPVVALPQIFFAMIVASTMGMVLYRAQHGPTVRCLLFAGIPIVLAANFLVGGSLIPSSMAIEGLAPVFVYGFFGQIFWMFGGLALLMLLGHTAALRNLGPGMAGALSHAGLTGACTAGDFGEEAAKRAPILINVPFFSHVFVFSILAMSVVAGGILTVPALVVAGIGIGLTVIGLRNLRRAQGERRKEVPALMFWALGWQLTALFGGMLLLRNLPLPYGAMATSAALSHFGLFAAVQGGMFDPESAALVSFVFAMPFLVHPAVFFLFGRGMETGGDMPRVPIFVLAVIGLLGIVYGLIML